MIKLWCRTCKNLTKQIINFEFIKNLPYDQAGTSFDDEGIDSKEILLKHSKKKLKEEKKEEKMI